MSSRSSYWSGAGNAEHNRPYADKFSTEVMF